MRKSDLVFFLSGAAALSYEVVWARLLARVLGSDASAAGIVIAVFMGGLGLGARLGARRAASVERPVRAFAALLGAIALWAALSPWILRILEPIDGTLARMLVAALALVPPTLAMGATFPLMARLSIRTRAEATSETSAFYGANTLGAAAGTLLCAFVLMPALGLSGALVASAVLDLAAAGLALAWLRDGPAAPEPARIERALWRDPLLVAALVFGLSGLAVEVLALRLLVTVTGASVYAFALVLAVFLLGIGLGARQQSERKHERPPHDGEVEATARRARDVAFWCGVWAPLLVLAGLFALGIQLGEPDLFAGLSNRLPQGASALKVWLSHALFAALALLPCGIAFGMALPACAGALVARVREAQREEAIGALYAANTFGALVGSLLTSFVLMPAVGPRVALAIVAPLPLVAAFLLQPARWKPLAIGLVSTAALGFHVLRPAAPRERVEKILVAHDAHTSASVEELGTSPSTRVRSLRVNGKAEASTATVDVRLQYLLGHVPGLLHGGVERALVVGLGTGMTAGSLLDLPGLETLRIVEISPAVARAARCFDAWNGAVLVDPRTELVVADGRHHLATHGETWDLVTSDPVHPWTRGSSDLYTLEHFTRMRSRLAEGGVASQWLPLYELSTDDVRTIVATWCAAFEHVSAWLTAYDLVLVGSRAPLPNERALGALPLPAQVAAHGRAIGIASGIDVAALRCADDARLRAFASTVEPMRDDRPVIEFRAPLAFLSGYSTEVLRWAIEPAALAAVEPAAAERARTFHGLVARFLDELPAGFTPASDRLGDRLLALPPP